jgi:hypothetical protein
MPPTIANITVTHNTGVSGMPLMNPPIAPAVRDNTNATTLDAFADIALVFIAWIANGTTKTSSTVDAA